MFHAQGMRFPHQKLRACSLAFLEAEIQRCSTTEVDLDRVLDQALRKWRSEGLDYPADDPTVKAIVDLAKLTASNAAARCRMKSPQSRTQ